MHRAGLNDRPAASVLSSVAGTSSTKKRSTRRSPNERTRVQVPFTSTPGGRSTYSAFFRAVNDHIMRASGASHRGLRQILCECSRRDCAKTVALTSAEYRVLRQDPTNFIVWPGHELSRVQRVVARRRAAFVVAEASGCLDATPLPRLTPIALVADDEPAIRELCCANLRSAGIVVFEAADGQAALEQARTLSPDLVVTDVSMPVLDGFRLAEAMQRDDRTQSIPLIFISGESDRANESLALEVGAFAFLTKPFDPEVLTAVATGVLARFAADHSRRNVTPIRRARLTAAPGPPAA